MASSCARSSTASARGVCRGTYVLPKGELVVGGSILYRQFYDLAVLGGTGLYDNARGTLTVTRTHRKPVRTSSSSGWSDRGPRARLSA